MDIHVDDQRPIQQPGGLSPNAGALPQTTEVATPVLTGDGVTVTSATDLQELVEQLKLEQEERRKALADQQFSIVLMRLTSENAQLTEAQNKALADVAQATDDVAAKTTAAADAADAVDRAAQACAETQAALDASLVILEVKTKELERLVELQKKTPEERAQELERKESVAEAAQTEEEIAQRIQELTQEVEALTDGIAAQRDILVEQQAEHAAALQTSQTAQADLAAAQAALETATAALDEVGVAVLAEAIAVTAAQVKAVTEELPDAETDKEQTISILRIAEEIRERIAEENTEDLEKLLMKLPEALSGLVGASRVLGPLDLPSRDNLV